MSEGRRGKERVLEAVNRIKVFYIYSIYII
jgi:hypothetical protein